MPALTAVFDLDGTLVDTAADLIRATNRALGKAGLAPVAADKLKFVVSHGARALLEAGLAQHDVSKTATEVDALLDGFLADYARNIALESRPFPGAIEALEWLRSEGCRLAVCTNKREALARRLLAELKMGTYFHAVTGSDTLPVRKPDPGHLIGTVILADGDLSRTVMIGDSEIDIATGHAAGIPTIGVTFGYSRQPINTFRPGAIIGHFDELDAALAKLYPAVRSRKSA